MSKELADRVVALGIGRAYDDTPDNDLFFFDGCMYDDIGESAVIAESFVNDGRVVLALMEKCLSNKTIHIAMQVAIAVNKAELKPELLAAAICEACCDALEQAND